VLPCRDAILYGDGMNATQILDIAQRTARRYARDHEAEDCAGMVALALVEAQAAVDDARCPVSYAYRLAQRAAWRWLGEERRGGDIPEAVIVERVEVAEMRSRYVGCRGRTVERRNRLSRAQVAWAYDLALAKRVVG
jgi:hypothetical protein